jgi:hypothetical protein
MDATSCGFGRELHNVMLLLRQQGKPVAYSILYETEISPVVFGHRLC